MRTVLTPYLTAGATITAAGLIALTPAAPAVSQLSGLSHRAVTLSSVAADPAAPAADSLISIPGAQSWLNGLLPDVTVGSDGVPVGVDVGIPSSLNALLGMIGPWVLANNAMTDVFAQVQAGDFGALLTLPAAVFNAFFTGSGGIDVAGTTIPIFNGLFTGPQHVDMTLTLSQLVDTVGMGDQTLDQLLTTGGIADTPLTGLAGGLLGTLGLSGDSSITDAVDQLGFGNQSVAALAISLLDTVGVGNPTITDLAGQAGLADQSVAGVLIGVLPQLGITGDPTLLGALTQLSPGLAGQPLAALVSSLLTTAGIGNPSIVGLLGQFGLADQPLGGLLQQVVAAVAPGNPTITDLLGQFGVGSMTVGGLATDLLGDTGNQSVADLINTALGGLLGSPPATGMTLGDLVVDILQSQHYDMTLSELLASTSMSSKTVGELLAGTSIGDEKFTQILTDAGVGNQTLQQLGGLSDATCFFAPIAGIDCKTTLNGLMGDRTLLETLQHLHTGNNPTNFADQTLGQLLSATGAGNTQLSTIITGLNLNTPFEQFLQTLGLNDVTLNDVLHNGFPGLFDTSVISVLNNLGLNNIDIDTVIGRLGLDMTLGDALTKLGLDNVHLDGVLNSLLGGVQVGTVLDNLGLDDVHLSTFLDNLLGGVKVGTLLDDLDLNNVHLDDVLNSLLGGVQLNSVLTDLGLDDVTLSSVLDDLLGGTTVGDVVGDLGIGGTDVNDLLGGLGLSDSSLLDLHIGDFSGLFG